MIWMDVDAALAEVPVNCVALTDDSDFKTREESVVYNQAGLDLVWNFVTTAGAYSQTAVTPTTGGGDYDWTNQGNGMYSIGIPASGGASINNDTEGFGWFTGYATGILPWSGPLIGFRDANLNNLLIDSSYSATRGLAGTALPNAAADAAGGLPISDAGGLDLDSQLANTNEVTAARLSELDAGTAGKMANQVDEIRTDTEDLQTQLGTAGAGLTDLGGMSTTMKGEVNAEVDTALSDYDPPTKAELDTAESNIRGSDNDDLKTLSDQLDDLVALTTTISAIETADTVFDLTDGRTNDDAYNNNVVAVKDVSGGRWEVRKVSDYVGASKRITVDADFSFPLAVGDTVKIFKCSYSPTTAAGGGATVEEILQGNVADISQASYPNSLAVRVREIGALDR